MPKKFTFKGPEGSQISFTCPLQCSACQAMNTKGGQPCKNRTCIGVPYCWMHLLKLHHLRIKQSSVHNAGKGLFAIRRGDVDVQGNRVPIFKKGDTIIKYGGEPVTAQQLQARYGNFTAPYGLSVTKNVFENGACVRGVGTLANHAVKSLANAKYSYATINRRPAYAVIKALKNIYDGDEILVHYGAEYQLNENTKHHTL